MRVNVLFTVPVLGLLCAGAGPTTKAQFDLARDAAKNHLNSPPGQEYDRKLGEHFEQNNGPVMEKCFGSTKDPDSKTFEMVFRVSNVGKVVEALVWPETNIAVCFREALKAKPLPLPPEDDYWAFMEMRMQ